MTGTGTYHHPDFGGRQLAYTCVEIPEDNGNGVASTIAMMRRYAIEDARSADVRRVAQSLPPCPDSRAVVCAVFDRVKSSMRFQRDEITGAPISQDTVEVLIRPCDVAALSAFGPVVGDCDCHAMYAAALLAALGVRCSFATVAADSSDPSAYSHVYTVAYTPEGERIAVDASHGPYCGWEVANYARLREWPLDGSETGAANPLIVLGALVAGGYLAGVWKN